MSGITTFALKAAATCVRNPALRASWMASILLTFAAQTQGEENPPRPPNVLMIAVDDLRPMLGCYGDSAIRTPQIDRLAGRGTVFLRAYCQVPQCGPSRVSLLSGLRPDTLGVSSNVDRFRRRDHPGLLTLPEHFRKLGYHAQAFGKIYHDGHDDPQSWSVPSSPGRTDEILEMVDESAIAGLPFDRRADIPTVIRPRHDCPAIQAPDVPDETLHPGRMTSQVIAALGASGDRPSFLAVGYRRPHLPLVAPKRYFDLYPPDPSMLAEPRLPPRDAPIFAYYNSGIYAGQSWRSRLGIAPPETPGSEREAREFAGFELRSYGGIPRRGPIPEAVQIEVRRAYMACVSYVDSQVGRLLDALDRLGLAERTIIVLWSDHGWHLGEQGTWTKMTNFEWATRVPLIVAAPGRGRPGRKTAALAELVDVFPTLCDLAGLPIPDQAQGSSLVPWLDDPNRPGKPEAYSQFPRGDRFMGRAIRTDRYRYVEWTDRGNEEIVARELYDHAEDAGETVNLADQPARAGVIAGLSRRLRPGSKGE